jgi:transposase
MGVYCGIDLHAKVSQVAVLDEEGRVLLNRKIKNHLEEILGVLAPYGPGIHIAVESTFNWYWLVDGLQDAGHDVHLGHPLRLAMISKAKVKTDRRDAVTLGRLLRSGDFPEAYIYPRATRPVRDLVRQRTRLVANRAHEYAALRVRLYRLGNLDHTANWAKTVTPEELEVLFEHPAIRPLIHQEHARIRLFSSQIKEIEQTILTFAETTSDYEHLQTLPGVGVTLAAVILYESGEVSRFDSTRTYASYGRVVPGCAVSAGKVKAGRGKKQGNPHLKAAFTQAAVHAIRTNETVRRVYERSKAHHPGRGSVPIAINVIAHKLAQAAYHIMKEGTTYHEELLFGN